MPQKLEDMGISDIRSVMNLSMKFASEGKNPIDMSIGDPKEKQNAIQVYSTEELIRMD